ncbi:hypothetical protein ASPWEDRAFT_112249 [Aspergillus wentii DTO 134E9]|uniref:Macro domain-containing protein n=1 Tax=Aspergillus wentii DTO 134E9 TaxID=1073089 RepID=A0A1L9RJJ4_ASPWE|nr:uncharacterized protein ASPWEDRAFT_112249 [Aspergillus wentii DTO 134E9]OJJ35116.1 hypothetical protein ASPWEDRAFT_112249 [Aspergillus wentii DTO 134E9]
MEYSASDSQNVSSRLSRALLHLIQEAHERHSHSIHNTDWILEMDTWAQLETLRGLLCQRPPVPRLPSDILCDIDAVIQHQHSHSLLTPSASIHPSAEIKNPHSGRLSVNLSVWKGDITTLTDVTAIVNAANSELLGCFRPEHRCIDNVIHSAAGPRLRDACHSLMLDQGYPEPVGSVKVTPGFNIPASWVLHTVGPQLRPKQRPSAVHRTQLAECYRSCLEAAQSLPPLPDGRKVVVFCCISTGLFAFPSDVAAKIALETVVEWCIDHPGTSLTDIIFDTFLERDWELYRDNIQTLRTSDQIILASTPPKPTLPHIITSPAITKARTWIEEADYLIITAGAGLSAATGLDYTSTELFQKHFPAFTHLGLRRLYDVFGYEWSSLRHKWGYYFLHLNMVRNWPLSPLYAALRDLVSNRFESRSFIRTSNADGLFVANGFEAEMVSTPQGQYRFLQCFAKCRVDAVFPSAPFLDAALPFIDYDTQILTDESKIPRCQYCGGELTICVRGGDYFNPAPFRGQERKWRRFLGEVSQDLDNSADNSSGAARAVVLELGVGLNTPGVLRWPNEELVEESSSRGFRLIRAGMGASGCVSWDLEEQDLAVGIEGDLNVIIHSLLYLA